MAPWPIASWHTSKVSWNSSIRRACSRHDFTDCLDDHVGAIERDPVATALGDDVAPARGTVGKPSLPSELACIRVRFARNDDHWHISEILAHRYRGGAGADRLDLTAQGFEELRLGPEPLRDRAHVGRQLRSGCHDVLVHAPQRSPAGDEGGQTRPARRPGASKPGDKSRDAESRGEPPVAAQLRAPTNECSECR